MSRGTWVHFGADGTRIVGDLPDLTPAEQKARDDAAAAASAADQALLEAEAVSLLTKATIPPATLAAKVAELRAIRGYEATPKEPK